MTLKPISLTLAVAVVLNIMLLPQTVCAAGINDTTVAGQTSGTPVDSIDNLKMADASMDQCTSPIRRHFSRQIRHRAPTTTTTTTTTHVTNSSSTTTETLAPQVISSPAVVPASPTTVLQRVSQPVVIERPVTRPVVVMEHRHHRYLWPLALLAAAGIATAIAVPIALSGGGHHNGNLAAAQQNLLISESRSNTTAPGASVVSATGTVGAGPGPGVLGLRFFGLPPFAPIVVPVTPVTPL